MTAQPPEPGAECIPLRTAWEMIPDSLFGLAGCARQLLNWRKMYRFCSICGVRLIRYETERAMFCPACKQFYYPRINPVVIVLVSKADQLLLTYKANHLYPFWSLIAGFVEANESLEHAIEREIREEVGIRVENIRYAMSQPWPFPNNLMIGFTARYAGGELHPDKIEIASAEWFSPERLPILPSGVSIARRLIDQFLSRRDVPDL